MLRNKLFAQPSVKEKQTSSQIDNIQTNARDQSNKKLHNTLFLHYTHEQRLDSIKRDIHNIYSEVFQGTTALDIRLIIGHRNSRNIQLELVQTRPYSTFVKLKKLKSKLLYLLQYIIHSYWKNIFTFRIIQHNVNDSSYTN